MAKKQEMHGMAIKKSTGDKIFDAANAILMILLCFITLYPMWYVLCASFTENSYLVAHPGAIFWPHGFTVGSYKLAFSHPLILSGYLNILFVLAVSLPINIALTLFCGYFLASKNVLFKKPILFIIMFTMFFSGGMIPMYLTVQQLHIYNTTWAMVLPVAVSAYNLIVCRSFFESGIPVELLEAAKIDGCSDFGFFFKIAIPLSKTIIAVMCLFYATAMWNQFFNALMFLQDDSKMPLQVVLRNLVLMNQSNQMGSSASEMVTKQKLAEQLKYCVVVVSAFPLLCVYPFLQKYFAKGVTIGAVKG